MDWRFNNLLYPPLEWNWTILAFKKIELEHELRVLFILNMFKVLSLYYNTS